MPSATMTCSFRVLHRTLSDPPCMKPYQKDRGRPARTDRDGASGAGSRRADPAGSQPKARYGRTPAHRCVKSMARRYCGVGHASGEPSVTVASATEQLSGGLAGLRNRAQTLMTAVIVDSRTREPAGTRSSPGLPMLRGRRRRGIRCRFTAVSPAGASYACSGMPILRAPGVGGAGSG